MPIGFSNGAFYLLDDKKAKRFSRHHRDLFKVGDQATAIELHCSNKYLLRYLLNKVPAKRFTNFSYISLHAPVLAYQKSKKTREVLDLLRELCQKWPIKNIVIHPDTVKNWRVFIDCQDLPLSIENMDANKLKFKTPSDFTEIFSKLPFLKLTLDLQHCYMIDTTMKLAADFQQKFADRLVEYHLSAYSEEIIHDALYKNPKENVIMEVIQNKNLPIILESSFSSYEDLPQEWDYVLKNLKIKK